jgi:UDP-glucose 4-epimerase
MKNGHPVVLVTGASGFVGRHLAGDLARSRWVVRRAVRTPSGYDDEVVIESIGPETEWREALADVDAAVHLAARVHNQYDEHTLGLYRNLNTEGTLRLARCAAGFGVREFIFISTALVHGKSNNGRAPFREATS